MIPEDARFETKFVTTPGQLGKIEQWLKLHRADFYQPYPDRRINNIYFDTFDYFSYAENLSGVSERTKLRYRWYGHQSVPGAGHLEVKMRRNVYGWKRRFRHDPPDASEGQSWKKFVSELGTSLGTEAKMWLDFRPFPVLINRYDRRYFLTRDGSVRITLDLNQAVFDQRFTTGPSYRRPTNIPDSLVIEVKCDRADRGRASEVINGLPVRVSRHSKYVVGVTAMLHY